MNAISRLVLTCLLAAGFAGVADAHTLSKSVFSPTDGTVVFTQDFADISNGSVLVIYDRSLTTDHSQYDCGIYGGDPTIAKPLISPEGWCADTTANTATTRIEPANYAFLEPVPGVDCRRLSYLACKAADPTAHEIFFTVAAPHACVGFEAPFERTVLLKPGVRRAIPLSIRLHDANGLRLTDADIASPVVNVSFSAGAGPASDVTDMLLPVGQASDGNHFQFDAATGQWRFTLGTSAFMTPGTYTVSVVAGATEAVIDPTCTGQFVRE